MSWQSQNTLALAADQTRDHLFATLLFRFSLPINDFFVFRIEFLPQIPCRTAGHRWIQIDDFNTSGIGCVFVGNNARPLASWLDGIFM